MPGGRGNISDIADALNMPNQTKTATAITMALDNGEYRITASVPMLGVAFAKSENSDVLMEVWCHAIENKQVDWAGY